MAQRDSQMRNTSAQPHSQRIGPSYGNHYANYGERGSVVDEQSQQRSIEEWNYSGAGHQDNRYTSNQPTAVRKALSTALKPPIQQSDNADIDGKDSSQSDPLVTGTKPKVGHTERGWLARFCWTPEVLSLLLAIAAFAAIVAILATHKDKEQPDWPSLININSLISILIAIFKTSLLFALAEGIGELKWMRFSGSKPQRLRDVDHWNVASNSPWGSLKLLCLYPTSLLAVLGAFVIMLSPAIDPFAQQALNFYTCSRPEDGAGALITKTNNYSMGVSSSVNEGNPVTDGPMTLAVYRGFLDPPTNSSSSISTFCPSGNCTFDSSYTSLAICSTVEDISSKIEGSGNFTEWFYKLPSGLMVLTGILLQSNKTAYSPGPLPEDTPILEFETLMVSLDCQNKSAYSPTESTCSTSAMAFRTIIYPCLHSYADITYRDGVFTEIVHSTVRLPYETQMQYYSLAGNYPSAAGIDCSSSSAPDGDKTQPCSLAPSGRLVTNHSSKASEDLDIQYLNPACTYDFGGLPRLGLAASLDSLIIGPYNAPRRLLSVRGLSSQLVGDSWMNRLWANGTADLASVTRYMDGITASVTAALRAGGDPSNSNPVRGQILSNRTCVGVNWPWLAMPAALLLVALAFLVPVIWQSQSMAGRSYEMGGRKPWKSSMLPLLWCGLRDSPSFHFKGSDRVEEMQKHAGEAKVTLQRTAPSANDEGGIWVFQAHGT